MAAGSCVLLSFPIPLLSSVPFSASCNDLMLQKHRLSIKHACCSEYTQAVIAELITRPIKTVLHRFLCWEPFLTFAICCFSTFLLYNFLFAFPSERCHTLLCLLLSCYMLLFPPLLLCSTFLHLLFFTLPDHLWQDWPYNCLRKVLLSLKQGADWLMNWLADVMIGWWADWLMRWLVDELIGWWADWLMSFCCYVVFRLYFR